MTIKYAAYEEKYKGERAVWLKYDRYEAVLLPELGGNLIAFRDTVSQYSLLREPAEENMNDFKQNPFEYGIPVLFPPNRYEDGKLAWNGKVYQLPVNEPATGNHLHGFLHAVPWTVEHYEASEWESSVTISVKVAEGHSVYDHFPHSFTLRIRYTLSSLGLQQQVTVQNDGQDSMPNLLGFHTTINVPFVPGSTAQNYRLKLTIGERRELSSRQLPTGKFQPLTAEEVQMKNEGVYPFFAEMDNHYTSEPQNGRNRMELTDTANDVTLVYDVGTAYKHWMVWNNFGREGYICPEPQINLVNAPNVNLPAEEIGLIALEPGEIWEETSRLYILHR
ncbi:aldose 1-epimerase [Paenibacillus sediminis]|uniref:Aldose 1-epimerase n=1 Tax=Paenibacillus sediminis TaxID=664909 RepID=A0ABS4GZA8_9BACL|nr:aldose 1-epimerase [Paenibacillus sediminis]MBP1935589.1 aldose 1-epimerase [Paenibacillus sediminis]